MARKKQNPKQIIKQLRIDLATANARIVNLETTKGYYMDKLKAINEEQLRRENQNVTNLTNGLIELIQKITGRRVKNLQWSWE
jgi:hypothetical protein